MLPPLHVDLGLDEFHVDPSSALAIAIVVLGGREIVTLAVKAAWRRGVDPALDRVSSARRHRRHIAAQIDDIVATLGPNGGTSILDRMTEVETGQREIRQAVEFVTDRVELLAALVANVDPDEQ